MAVRSNEAVGVGDEFDLDWGGKVTRVRVTKVGAGLSLNFVWSVKLPQRPGDPEIVLGEAEFRAKATPTKAAGGDAGGPRG